MRIATRSDQFARAVVRLYAALLGAGETEISGKLLESSMDAAAAVAGLSDQGEELLGRSLFWICQVPDPIACDYGGEAFRLGLRLLLELRKGAEEDKRGG